MRRGAGIAHDGDSKSRIVIVATMPLANLPSIVSASRLQPLSTHFNSIGVVDLGPPGVATLTGARSTSLSALVREYPMVSAAIHRPDSCSST
jgi:hypothetical protein